MLTLDASCRSDGVTNVIKLVGEFSVDQNLVWAAYKLPGLNLGRDICFHGHHRMQFAGFMLPCWAEDK